MNWAGSTVYTLWNYTPETIPAIDFHKLANGNWRGSDRGSSEDVYNGRVTFEGPISELTSLESVLDSNRTFFSATFSEGEEIFGADVDHSSNMDVIVIGYGKIKKIGFKKFGMDLLLRLPDPTFKAVTPDFSVLRKSSHQDTRETEFEINKMFSYDGEGFAVDHIANDGDEAGTFTATFQQTMAEMAKIRRYLLVTARANKIAFPSFDDMSYPFGTRAGTGPFNCRVIKWADLGRIDYQDWRLSITFVKDNTYWNEGTDIIQETGSAPDTIVESGSQPDQIVEVIN